MHLHSYSPVSNHTHDAYEFLSQGLKGTVKKVVLFQRLSPGVYNLAYGDWDEEAQEISDEIRTNNADREKVQATIAVTVLDFMAYHQGWEPFTSNRNYKAFALKAKEEA